MACVDKFSTITAYEKPSEAMARNVNFVAMDHVRAQRITYDFTGDILYFVSGLKG
jgi:hypothetical protein